MRRKRGRVLLLVGALAAGGAGTLEGQQAEPAGSTGWGFGTDIGFTNGTAEGSVFTLRFNADRYFSSAFSFGPSLMITPVQEYSELSVAGIARFRIPIEIGMELVPFSGIGFVDADFEREDSLTQELTAVDDVSIYFPVGLAVDLKVAEEIFAVGTLLVNLHSLDFDAPIGKDEASVTFLLGVHYKPGRR